MLCKCCENHPDLKPGTCSYRHRQPSCPWRSLRSCDLASLDAYCLAFKHLYLPGDTLRRYRPSAKMISLRIRCLCYSRLYGISWLNRIRNLWLHCSCLPVLVTLYFLNVITVYISAALNGEFSLSFYFTQYAHLFFFYKYLRLLSL